MNIEQIYTGCLAQGAYYITSNGEAAIIDPLREVQPYIDRAKVIEPFANGRDVQAPSSIRRLGQRLPGRQSVSWFLLASAFS